MNKAVRVAIQTMSTAGAARTEKCRAQTVTLPSSSFNLMFHIYFRIGSLCYCKRGLMWLVLLLCGHK